MFLAGAGVLWASRRLGVSKLGALSGAMVYQLSPFLLAYVSRTSLLLLPWASLGWIVGLTVRATLALPADTTAATWRLRLRPWREPALIALIVATVGSTNATALAMIVPAPVLWILHVAWQGRISWRRAAAVTTRELPCCVWPCRRGGSRCSWSSHETGSTCSHTARPSRTSAATQPEPRCYGDSATGCSTSVTRSVRRPPPRSTTSSVSGRWPSATASFSSGWPACPSRRGHNVATPRCASPSDSCSPSVSTRSIRPHRSWRGSRETTSPVWPSHSAAVPVPSRCSSSASPSGPLHWSRQLRNGPRRGCTPRSCGTETCVCWPRWASGPWPSSTFRHSGLGRSSTRRSIVIRTHRQPGRQRVERLATTDDASRVLQLPGQEFGAFRWGYTTDHPLVALTDKPVVTRDLIPFGSPAAMDVLYALDDRVQDGTIEPASFAPIARLFGADVIWLSNDSAFERFRTARPEVVDAELTAGPRRHWIVARRTIRRAGGECAGGPHGRSGVDRRTDGRPAVVARGAPTGRRTRCPSFAPRPNRS